MSAGRFIVSTGRSGSTLLSRMLAENSRVLALSEFLASVDGATRFCPEPVSGAQFLKTLSADDDLSALIARHGRQSEEILNPGRGHSVTATGRAPSLVRVALAALTDDPEGLFEEISAFAAARPVRSMAAHYTALFEWLCERLGKECWLERSGMSIRIVPSLRAAFPEARYLHLHRDGLETALSMHAHPWFRIGVWFDSHPPTSEEARALLRSAGCDPEDLIARLYREPPPLAPYGEHWSNYMALAYRDFVHLAPGNYRELRFEDMVADVCTALTELAVFFELPDDPGWIDRAATLVSGSVPLRAGRLPPDDHAALARACRPGQILTGRSDAGGLDGTMAMLRAAWLEQKGGVNHE